MQKREIGAREERGMTVTGLVTVSSVMKWRGVVHCFCENTCFVECKKNSTATDSVFSAWFAWDN